MITVYKKKGIPKDLELIRVNDIYFNKYTAALLDEKAKQIIRKIDGSDMLDKFSIGSRFDGSKLNIDKLSTGCKTTLNVLYNPDKIFDIAECGDNALDVIYSLDNGKIYCDYPMISFDMDKVQVTGSDGPKVVDDYENLKEWWMDED